MMKGDNIMNAKKMMAMMKGILMVRRDAPGKSKKVQ